MISMNNNQYVKQQHVVPRAYLKNFADKNNKVHAYNKVIHKNLYLNYENVCSHEYSYEVSNHSPDNILEDELANLEALYLPNINNILRNINDNFNNVNDNALFKYMMLQSMRSDSGRINMTRAIRDLPPMISHMTLEQQNKYHYLITLFNAYFSKKRKISEYLEYVCDKEKPYIKIGISVNADFITSDNPVVSFFEPSNYFPKEIRMVMPISSKICLIYDHSLCSGNKRTEKSNVRYLSDRNVTMINQAIVNVSDYWIISMNDFPLFVSSYIYNDQHQNEEKRFLYYF